MSTTDIYFETIRVINWVVERHEAERQQPWSYSLAEKIAAALSNAGLLRSVNAK